MDNVISGLAILPAIYFVRSLDFEIGDRKEYAYNTFIVVQSILALCIAYIYWSIRSTRDQRSVSLTKNIWGQQIKKEIITVFEYDSREFMKLAFGFLLSLGMIFWGTVKWPEVVATFAATQCVIIPFRTFKSNLFKSHILGWNIPRPFPQPPSPFKQMWSEMKKELQSLDPNAKTPRGSKKKSAKKPKAGDVAAIRKRQKQNQIAVEEKDKIDRQLRAAKGHKTSNRKKVN
mmetsp:Transcript_18435/g.20495  ORF Transcript_18435/g.20495 Transcript_18435/m.20495 type:complete len:231 (-) Transcript_18435:133-825(-)